MADGYLTLVGESATLSRAAQATLEVERLDGEWARDVVDVRRLPGVRYSDHLSEHLLNFAAVPAPYVVLVKHYIRFKLDTGWSFSQSKSALTYNRIFLQWFHAHHPAPGDLTSLSRSDIDAYLRYRKSMTNRYGQTIAQNTVYASIKHVKYFLSYLKRTAHPFRPTQAIEDIIWPEHSGQMLKFNPNVVRFIPASVLA